MIAIASLFPNVKVAAVQCSRFAAKICEKQVWPVLVKLTCFHDFSAYSAYGFLTAKHVACPNLPSTVDLSPIVDKNLSFDANTLTAIYQAVQNGPVKTLLLRGPVHRESLSHLQAHIDLHGESAKVTALKDRDLGEQTSIMHYAGVHVPATEQTDVRISGTKEKGDVFTIRIVHQHKKKPDIFD